LSVRPALPATPPHATQRTRTAGPAAPACRIR
jgi:hypothetical protein